MQYMLLIYRDESTMQSPTQQERDAMMGAYRAYTDAMIQAGVHKAGAPLQSVTTATTVRNRDGKTQVLDGPYAETKEQLGGYYLIDVPDLDAALSWAARCPGTTYGTTEVRPVWEM
jgi:hypothetical protein